MGIFKKKDNEIQLIHIQGLPALQNQLMDVIINKIERKIYFIEKAKVNKKEYSIFLNDIKFSGMLTEEVSKPRSSLGRAIAGGLLFGTTGAVVGAVSGVKDKTKKESYYVIEYNECENTKFIQMALAGDFRITKFDSLLKSLTNQNQ